MRLKYEEALDRGQVRSNGLAKSFMRYRDMTQSGGLIQADHLEILAT